MNIVSFASVVFAISASSAWDTRTFLLSAATQAQSQNLDRNKDLTQANELTSQLVKLSKEGRYKEALPLAQKVVEIRQQLLSPDDTSLGSAFANLGELYFANKKDSEAEKALQRALAIYEQHIERTSLEISKVLDRLAHIRFHKNDYDGADALFMRSLTIKERELGPTNPSTIEAMKDYACLDLIARNSKGGLLHTEQDEAKRRLTTRAWCWLDGFSNDCANQVSRGVKPQGVVNGRAVRLVTPKYPYVFGQKRFAGKVFVSVLIDEAGNVIKAKSVCSGPRELNEAGTEAARASKFTPMNVQVTGIIVYNFVAH